MAKARAKQSSNQTPAKPVFVKQRATTTIKPSPFLPPVPNVALGDLNRVVFPGVTNDGHGLLTAADRDVELPQNQDQAISGPSTYTRRPTTNRVGGNFPPVVGNLN